MKIPFLLFVLAFLILSPNAGAGTIQVEFEDSLIVQLTAPDLSIVGGGSNSFWFHTSAGDTVKATLVLWNSAYELSWYNTVGNPNKLYLLFGGSDSAGSTASFAPSENFALMLSTPDGNFRTRGDGDRFHPYLPQESQVPEPSTYGLLGTGITLIGFIRRQLNC